ncbi:glycosyltransferase [Acetoanaerobium sticklandii]|uniref:glycosyltransferase n=1 Tax=Acetoanaerobium sticklandii TaxID=1511 RepID=UPI003A9313CE
MNICIIIPCYNEEKRLDIDKYEDFLASNKSVNLLFVNDGSVDNTSLILSKLSEKYSNSSFIDLTQNFGKANAVREGVLASLNSKYDIYAYMDADLAVELDEIPAFINLFDNEKIHFVMGSRWMRLGSNIKRKISRHYIGRVFATLASISLGLKVYDTQCGAKFFRHDLAAFLFKDKLNAKWLFDVELLFRFMASPKYKISNIFEYPVSKWTDVDGSKLKLRDFLKAPLELVNLIRIYK